MREKPYRAIALSDVLELAGVGRSTFYTHFRDKNDLFLSNVEQFFEGVGSLLTRQGDTSRRVAPVHELFAHVAEMRDFWAALVAADKVPEVLEIGRGCLARSIERRVAGIIGVNTPASATRAALGEALAGALLSLMTWWIDHDMRPSPVEMDELYHEVVWEGVSGRRWR